MSGTLFVVATPIGNLEDITLRALRVLRTVALIAAEDTRRTARLLVHHGISTRTVSFHEHNTRMRLSQLLARLEAGDDVAVVSDAGTPGMSDPGVELVQACLARDIRIDPVPGASAALTALVGSGFPTDEVVVLGFPPAKGNDRKRWLRKATLHLGTVVFFESPHRIRGLLSELVVLLADRPIVVGRELTKLHQEFLRGTAEKVASQMGDPRGEFTVVLGPVEPDLGVATPVSETQVRDEFVQITNSGTVGRREAVVLLSKRYGYRSRQVYAMIEATKDSGE
ncbi:MAG: 16S rRNA (cytidine(1402)-2'-O)-methyltransferase [Acidobacteria bacterium]|nr:16S rRNA (cytidine(1402)-2'-O)-methyltransferase [Acidobacteriota bacterium]